MAENEVKLPELPRLQRYRMATDPEGNRGMYPDMTGSWLRWNDVESALRAHATEAVRMNQAAGGEVVAVAPVGAGVWTDDEIHGDTLRCAISALERAGLGVLAGQLRLARDFYTTPPAAQVQQEAVELTVCCGREECGGECGNEWRGTEWVRKATHPAADALGAVRELYEREVRPIAADWKRRQVPGWAVMDGIAEHLESALAQAPAVRELAAEIERIMHEDCPGSTDGQIAITAKRIAALAQPQSGEVSGG